MVTLVVIVQCTYISCNELLAGNRNCTEITFDHLHLYLSHASKFNATDFLDEIWRRQVEDRVEACSFHHRWIVYSIHCWHPTHNLQQNIYLLNGTHVLGYDNRHIYLQWYYFQEQHGLSSTKYNTTVFTTRLPFNQRQITCKLKIIIKVICSFQ